jgi:hypothetical protein
MTFDIVRAIGHVEEAALCDDGAAIECQAGLCEAGEDELVIAGGNGCDS